MAKLNQTIEQSKTNAKGGPLARSIYKANKKRPATRRILIKLNNPV